MAADFPRHLDLPLGLARRVDGADRVPRQQRRGFEGAVLPGNVIDRPCPSFEELARLDIVGLPLSPLPIDDENRSVGARPERGDVAVLFRSVGAKFSARAVMDDLPFDRHVYDVVRRAEDDRGLRNSQGHALGSPVLGFAGVRKDAHPFRMRLRHECERLSVVAHS